MKDANGDENERTAQPAEDASADWRTEYFHQGVRVVGAFTSRNGDHLNVAGPQSGVSLSDFADGGGGAGERDGRNVEGGR